MGRRKKTVDGKLCGRNELLMKQILTWTGELRDRKQISSHIQVLKGFMPHNEGCRFLLLRPRSLKPNSMRSGMKHVTLDEKSSLAATQASIFDNIDISGLRMEAEEVALYARSGYGDSGPATYSNAPSLPPPNGILRSNAPGHRPYLNRVEFEMYVVSPSGQKIHDYTSNQADVGAPSRELETVCNWRTSYPLLEDYYEQGQLDSEIILIESDLNLFGEYPPHGSTLSIGFKVNIAGLQGDAKWFTRTEYYENDGQSVDMRTFYERNDIRKPFPWDRPNIIPGSDNSSIGLEIPLQSRWWVHLFTKMAKRKQEMKLDPYLSQEEDKGSRRYLQEMSIMQELWVRPAVEGSSDSRVAIILWKFSQTHAGHAGTTTWRKLKPPPSRIKVNSPSQSPPPPLQHPMVLDSALQTLAMPQALSTNTERFLHNANLFAQDSEHIITGPQSGRGSASPTLSLDYTTSFPSSTSTSFPPSVTHGYLSHEDSQESACYSQESERSRNGSLDAQYAHVFPQKSTYTYQEPKTYDDPRYLPGSQEAESQDAAYYSHQSFDSISQYQTQSQYDSFDGDLIHDGSFTAHDFTGGQIQLSFDQHSVVSNARAAPTSDMVVHVEHPPGSQDQPNDQQLQPVTHSLMDIELQKMFAEQAHHTDFDFATLENHFTPDEIAVLRSYDPEHRQHGELGELLSSHGEAQHFDRHQPDQQPLLATANHFDDTTFTQTEHGAVPDEVEDEEFEDVAGELGFEEVDYEERQAVDGQGHNYDAHGQQEDALRRGHTLLR